MSTNEGLDLGAVSEPHESQNFGSGREDVSAALSAARAGAWRLKVREGQIEWEPPLSEVLREPMRAFSGSEESFLQCIHPADIDMVREVIREAKESGGEFECEFRLALDTKGRWMQLRGTSSLTNELNAPQVSGIGFEVTSRRHSDFRFQAFYDLTTALSQVTQVTEVFDAAIDAILGILDADRASILIFDEDDVLRFKAWRNLSDDYRQKVEGHSPWTRDSDNPEPITVSVVSEATLGDLAPTVLEEGIHALAFVPLRSKTGLLGKFMVYFDSPREFTSAEIEVAATIASHVSYAIERQAADEAQARLATIVENSDDAIVSKSLDGIITSWNAAAERIFGYTASEAVGQSMRLIVPKDRLSEEEEILRRLRCGERIDHFETVRRTKHGRSVHVSITVSPVKDSHGQVVGASNIARDIRDVRRSKEVLESLVRIGARFSSTLEPKELLAMLLDEAAKIVGARPGHAGVCAGDRLEALIGMDAAGGFGPDDEMAAGSDARDCREWLLEELTGLSPHAVVTPILDSTGKLLGAFAVHEKTDGTPFDDSDRELLGAVANAISPALQNALTYRQQQETEKRLTEADHRKNEFLATLAHELRNPLAPIQTSVNLLQLKQNEDKNLAVATSVIERQVKQMARLIDDLMDVSRITRGRIQIHPEAIDLNATLQEAIETARPLLEKHGHSIEVSCGPNTVVMADPVRLAQIFGNILNNAIKYTEAGGRIEAASWTEGDSVLVSIKDNGIGIQAENLPKVFEMFAQETPAISRSQGGLGIGLWLVNRLVELHGGTVRCESPGSGLGSTFTISLPRHDVGCSANDSRWV